MTIRLVVSDVDGTLVAKDKTVLPESIAAARRLREAGIPLALVSSRPPRGLDYVREALGLKDEPYAAYNGGLIMQGGATIAQNLVPEAAARIMLDFLAGQNIDAWAYADDLWLVREADHPHVASETRTIGFSPTVTDDFSRYAARCGKIVGVSDDFTRLADDEAELAKILPADAVAQRSQTYYLDLTHRDANKGTAVRAIAARLGLDLADVAVIGDMTNDVPMFAVAGVSIAMGNAPAEVAAKARYQTGRNTESGWADAIEKFVLR